MRVIAGKRGHLNLLAPEGMETRPTTDRIKETLFNILQFDVVEAEFLDLFSGSGQMGIEALSRGASHCTFVEKDRKACEIINKNLTSTDLLSDSTLLRENVFDALRGFSRDKKFDIIFMDPPYAMHEESEILKLIKEFNICDENSIIIIEADKKRTLDFIDINVFSLEKQKIYKTNQHIFLKLKKEK
ncbi:MAG: 16S rRNA (guanine(966)-N(2))-methyltransferase RsmD [Lachnospiraceae bacterium]|jgi:16S rRNA (guanine966-N2)-methyltransferase|nr:16S rRNA (guanine(966)-N(2))-methyltransferase RsmD [Lachnospiraceae bacterium]